MIEALAEGAISCGLERCRRIKPVDERGEGFGGRDLLAI
jgi:hypothetical protein